MTVAIGLIAFAAPVDAGSSGAAPTSAQAGRSAPPRSAMPSRLTRGPSEQPTADDERRELRELAAARFEAAARTRTRAARTRRDAPGATDIVWAALAECESNTNPRAVSRTGKYRGAFQFSLSTWRSLGYGGDPIDHAYNTQLKAAKELQARSGWGQWPACARQLGLR